MGKYEDIINCSRPKSNMVYMPIASRAKIFMPFAALKGYDDAIDEKKKIYTERIELIDETKEEIDRQVSSIKNMLTRDEKANITIRFFEKDEEVSRQKGLDMGKYVEITGEVVKVDVLGRRIKIMDKYINIEDVYAIL